jgi:putative sterol carrier protein
MVPTERRRKTQMEIKTPQEFFDTTLPAKFDPSKVEGFDAVFQLIITGPNGGEWTVTVKDQKLDIKRETHPSPSITVTLSDTDFVDITNGKLSAERAFMTGRLKFEGSISTALRLKDLGLL